MTGVSNIAREMEAEREPLKYTPTRAMIEAAEVAYTGWSRTTVPEQAMERALVAALKQDPLRNRRP